MSALVQRALSAETLTRPDRALAFLDAISSSMTVDPGLDSISEMGILTTRMLRVPADRVTFVVMPWEVSPDNPNRVVASADASVVFAHLAEDTPIPLSPTGEDTSDSSGSGVDATDAPGVAPPAPNEQRLPGLGAHHVVDRSEVRVVILPMPHCCQGALPELPANGETITEDMEDNCRNTTDLLLSP